MEGYCFLKNEAESRKGSNEVSTAIYEGIINYDEEGIKHLFADGCSGQNKTPFCLL